ncbi:hypothetical protein [Nesterenkonia sp. HG001]|uniref:hypothetical protein n=1 Tax=Nesterenkonia sp. HG001 TaxID=2983207 RepID=UPI002AC652CE|nr:hypothetical protein [Nesterenkonia sp. HG001]MDZ5076736.1 hypothetical protein [Nesterenkonia sp. HG001]
MARRIGVELTSGVRSGPTNTGTPSGILHLAGLAEKGPTSRAVTVRSFATYTRLYGDRAPYAGNLFDAARLFFEEGGSELLVSRVVGPAASAASVDLLTPDDGEGGGQEPVARIQANDFGGFANQWSVRVEQDDETYTVQILDGDDEVLAAWRGIDSVEELVTRSATSTVVTITSLTEDSGSLLLETGDFDLQDGDDDRESIGTEDVIDALHKAGTDGEGGAVAVPGYPADVIGGQLADYASSSRKIALLSADADATLGEVQSLAAELQSSIDGQYAGLFFPHVTIPDGNASRVVSPEAFVAALRARAFSTGQFWSIPAGVQRGRARWVVGTATPISADLNDQLDEAHVNGIQTNGSRIYLNNWASLAVDRDNFEFLSARDVLNNLKVQIQRVLEPFVWETIDGRGHLLSDIEGAVTSILSPIANQNGFYAATDSEGEELDPGYRVLVDATNNSTETAADNRVQVDVSVRLSPAAKLIQVEIVKVALGAAL